MSREIVKIELTSPDKVKLSNQITAQMEKLGLGADISKLDLGFALPDDWPMDLKDNPTMAQLVVLAHKLNMEIIISSIDLFADGKRE